MGLVQREIEAAGITTIILANIPDFAVSVSAPRVVGIEYPFGQQLGRPGDAEGQGAVLRAVLDALVEIETPGEVRHLPFQWPEDVEYGDAPEPTPIATYLTENPFQIPKLVKRRVP